MNISAFSPLARSTPVRGSAVSSPVSREPQVDRVELGSSEARVGGWRGLGLAGMASLALLGAAGCAQAQTQPAASEQAKGVGDIKGLFLAKGHVDAEGKISNVLGWPMARIKTDGTVTGPLGYVPKGHVDDKGRVFEYGAFFPSGRVDPDGTVRDELGLKIGKVQGEDPNKIEQVEKGGAALLILMKDDI